MVAGQDQHQVRVAIRDEVEVLQHGVGGAAIPVTRPPATDVRLQQRHAAVAAVQVPRTADADVIHQRARGVLGQDRHVGEPELTAFESAKSMIRYLPPNGTPGLARALGQHRQPLALAPGQDQSRTDADTRRILPCAAPAAVVGDQRRRRRVSLAPIGTSQAAMTGRRPGTGCRGRPAAACRRSRRSTPRRRSAPGCTGCSRCRGSHPRSRARPKDRRPLRLGRKITSPQMGEPKPCCRAPARSAGGSSGSP